MTVTAQVLYPTNYRSMTQPGQYRGGPGGPDQRSGEERRRIQGRLILDPPGTAKAGALLCLCSLAWSLGEAGKGA